mmetsp:Transcript_61204/g.164078  ORF Transcript_61204/g.164078 Transcript_61204/m.164078 type:complete len:110 (-) Transcript_61204:145-474(-)
MDNRRLWCLQMVAVRYWPRPCVIPVVAIEGACNSRDIRKFRTSSVGVCLWVSREAQVREQLWNWREAAKAQMREVHVDDGSLRQVLAHIRSHEEASSDELPDVPLEMLT